jgi:hypothetical protein
MTRVGHREDFRVQYLPYQTIDGSHANTVDNLRASTDNDFPFTIIARSGVSGSAADTRPRP